MVGDAEGGENMVTVRQIYLNKPVENRKKYYYSY
jgi:hypothetical protein